MAQLDRRETSSGTFIAGWIILLGISFLITSGPIIVLCIIGFYLLKYLPNLAEEEKPKAEDQIVSHDLDTLVQSILDQGLVEDFVPDEIIEDATSVLRNLGYNKSNAVTVVKEAIDNGAVTLEEIVSKSLQIINSHK